MRGPDARQVGDQCRRPGPAAIGRIGLFVSMGVRPDVGPHCPNEYGAVVESILAVELPTVTPGLMCVCHLPRLKSKSCCPSRSAGLAAKTDSLAAASGSANAMQARA